MKRIWLLLLLILVHPSVLWAQSQFGNLFVLSGATCPPVNPPANVGTLYTCTGDGSLYNWTGSTWNLVVAGGSTIGGAIQDTQVAVGSGADTIGGSSLLTWTNTGGVTLLAIGHSVPPMQTPAVFVENVPIVAISQTDWSQYENAAQSDGFAGAEYTASFIAKVGDKNPADSAAATAGTLYDIGGMFFEYNDTTNPNSIDMAITLRIGGGSEVLAANAVGDVALGNVTGNSGTAPTSFTAYTQLLQASDRSTIFAGDIQLANGKSFKTDPTVGHTALIQAYDNDTGPAYVTFATLTNGNSPSLVVSPPTGGSTVSLTANAFATSSTTAVAVANVGANSCGTSAASIAGNDTVGAVTVGATSATQCRITFTVAAATRRHCVVSDETTAAVAATLHTSYVDSTHTDILGTITAADVITYNCWAR